MKNKMMIKMMIKIQDDHDDDSETIMMKTRARVMCDALRLLTDRINLMRNDYTNDTIRKLSAFIISSAAKKSPHCY